MTLGEKILELRRRNAISQDALAERLDVSRQAVCKWERDEAIPETDKIVKLAQVFGVTTDYLLLDGEPQPRQTPPQTPPRPTGTFERRIEPFVRRHGYKIGFVPMAIGAFLCVIALLVMCLMPNFGSGMFDSAIDPGNSWNGGIIIEGDADIPPEVLEDLLDQSGAHFGDSFFDSYQNDVNQMHSAWQGSLRIMAALFGVPVMLAGLGLIALGIFIVVKGKKYAAQAM